MKSLSFVQGCLDNIKTLNLNKECLRNCDIKLLLMGENIYIIFTFIKVELELRKKGEEEMVKIRKEFHSETKAHAQQKTLVGQRHDQSFLCQCQRT